jgi:hypothetical protein
MIIYRDSKPHERSGPPPWLAGAMELYQRDGIGIPFRFWGVGSPWLVGEHADRKWHSLADGWHCCMVDGPEPELLQRNQRWCDTDRAVDLGGNQWLAPRLLSEDGTAIYRVSYGADWLPSLTPEQYRADDVAKAARAALLVNKEGGPAPDQRAVCQWAAELLCVTHHLDTSVIAALSLLDDALVLTTLSAACGLPLKLQEPQEV